MMHSFQNQTTNVAGISAMSIEYRDGFYEVIELATPISKHKCLQEAQWIKSVLERESSQD